MQEGKELLNIKNYRKKVLIQMRDLRVGNGIAACIMNYYEYAVQHGFSIDFLLNRNIESPYVDIVKKYGSNLFILPHDTGKPDKKNIVYIRTIVTNIYDIFHVNTSGLNALEGLVTAKKAGIRMIIYHAHNPKETSSLKARIRSMVYEGFSVRLANKYVACSSCAGDSIFGKKNYTVVKNIVDIDKFIFNKESRFILRKELEIEDNYVVGVVARFAEQKNPFFLIDIFAELKKREKKFILIWAGEGELKNSVSQYIKQKGLASDIKFLGVRNDINKLYSAMDLFLLPSKFEGFGLVFIEAQIAGLPCFGSDKVPADVEISDNMHRISIKKSAKEWADVIIGSDCMNITRSYMIGKESTNISEIENTLIKLYDE